MKVLDEICDITEDILGAIAKKDNISPTELDSIYKSVDIIKDVETIKAMRGQNGYSNYGSYGSYNGSYGDSYMMGGSNAGYRDSRYSNELRGRDSMGRYTSRDDGYSREHEKEMLREELMNMSRKLERM